MDAPEYFVVDEMGVKDEQTDLLTGGVMFNVKQAMGLATLNYQYGFPEELNETLQKMVESGAPYDARLFPLVYLLQPFKVKRGIPGVYGRTEGLRLFVINKSEPGWKAKERMKNNFKPIIFPIYREILKQLDLSVPFSGTNGLGPTGIKHGVTDVYYWAEENKRILNQVTDTLVIDNLELDVHSNPNCSPAFKLI